MQLQLVASPEADVGRPRRVDVGVGRSSQSLKTGGRFSWRARTASSKFRVVMRHRLADQRDAGPGVVDQYEVVYGGHGGRR